MSTFYFNVSTALSYISSVPHLISLISYFVLLSLWFICYTYNSIFGISNSLCYSLLLSFCAPYIFLFETVLLRISLFCSLYYLVEFFFLLFPCLDSLLKKIHFYNDYSIFINQFFSTWFDWITIFLWLISHVVCM